MEDNIEINKVVQENRPAEEKEYDYNFINKPWDDRTKGSQIGIISLLVAIFVATMALVVHNLIVIYKGFDHTFLAGVNISCNIVKVDEHPYVARIQSISSNKVVCLGVVLTPNSVLTNDICLKSGPIRLRLGKNPLCKKGFSVDKVDPIPHHGSITKSLVLLTTNGNMRDCADTIEIGTGVNVEKDVHIIGRPHRGDKNLSFQIAKIDSRNITTLSNVTRTLDQNNVICVRGISECPVRVSDLLVQDFKILGLASTSVHERDKAKMVCFAKLSVIQKDLTNIYGRSDSMSD